MADAEPSSEPSSSTAVAVKLNIRVRDQQGQDTIFKIKSTTKLKKIFAAYADTTGVQVTSLRFLGPTGDRLDGERTAGESDLEDDDQIDCMIEQVGGVA